MKIKKSYLKKIIKEELNRTFSRTLIKENLAGFDAKNADKIATVGANAVFEQLGLPDPSRTSKDSYVAMFHEELVELLYEKLMVSKKIISEIKKRTKEEEIEESIDNLETTQDRDEDSDDVVDIYSNDELYEAIKSFVE